MEQSVQRWRRLSFSSFIEAFFGAYWASLVLQFLGITNQIVLIVWIAVAAILLIAGLWSINDARRQTGGMSPFTNRGDTRLYILINVLQFAAFLAVIILCSHFKHTEFIAPLNTIVVGLHFFAITPTLHEWRLLLVGGAFVGGAVITMLVLPAHAQFSGHDIMLWGAVVSAWAALILWGTAISTHWRIAAIKRKSVVAVSLS